MQDDKWGDWHRNEPLANSSFIGEGGLDFRIEGQPPAVRKEKAGAETMLIGPRAGFTRCGLFSTVNFPGPQFQAGTAIRKKRCLQGGLWALILLESSDFLSQSGLRILQG